MEKLQPLSLYAESAVHLKGMDECIHIFNDTDSHTLRVVGANTKKERELATEHIKKYNKRRIPIIWE